MIMQEGNEENLLPAFSTRRKIPFGRKPGCNEGMHSEFFFQERETGIVQDPAVTVSPRLCRSPGDEKDSGTSQMRIIPLSRRENIILLTDNSTARIDVYRRSPEEMGPGIVYFFRMAVSGLPCEMLLHQSGT